MEQLKKKYFLNNAFSFITKILFILLLFSSFYSCENSTDVQDHKNFIDPTKYLPTLQFDGQDLGDSGEQNFPQSYRFNTTQDANNDGALDAEDNLENLIRISIGDSLIGEGRTGLLNRGPNDQRPAVYFHFVRTDFFDVYEYWLYYADNDWINDHEHDWEKYFVYEINSEPIYIKISNHLTFETTNWKDIILDNGHPVISVDGGSHAMKFDQEDGVRIRYNGEISSNNGNLATPNLVIIPWVVYSNDTLVSNSIEYSDVVNTFYYGDPSYFTNSNEYGDPQDSPWLREEWDNPPIP